jgi:hypothetical protein
MFSSTGTSITSTASSVRHASGLASMTWYYTAYLCKHSNANSCLTDSSQDGKAVCADCLPQCDGCNLPLIPSTGLKHNKPRSQSNTSNNGNANNGGSPAGSGSQPSVHHNKENINVNISVSGGMASEDPRTKGSGAHVAISDDKEDGEMEMAIERDGVVQRFHRKCILKCPSCRLPIQRKHGKLYKKQVRAYCLVCRAPCVRASYLHHERAC